MEEISVLIAQAQAGDNSAREVLIEKNLGLVHHIVKRFSGRGYDMEDLFQIGTIGLIKACLLYTSSATGVFPDSSGGDTVYRLITVTNAVKSWWLRKRLRFARSAAAPT